MLDLRTCAALPHVGGVVPLFERLRCSLHGCELCHNRCHAGCTSSPLWQEQALSTCAAVEQPDSVPEPRHCRSRVLAGLRLVDPPWISCSVGERAPHRYLRLSTKPAAGAGSCVKPQRRGRGVDSRDLDPALGNLPRPCASL